MADDQGREVPCVGTALARWPDGSIKWLLLDFPVRVAALQTASFTLECGARPLAKLKGPRVTTVETQEAITVTTGALRFRIHRQRYTFLEAAALDRNGDGRFSDSERLIAPGKGDSRLEIETTPPGPPEEENWLRIAAGGPQRSFIAAVTQARVEFHNPLRAVVLVRGEYRDQTGQSIGPFWTRYTAWAGSTALGVAHFVAFDADVEKAFLRTASLGLQFAGRAPLKTNFGVENDEAFTPPAILSEIALLEVAPHNQVKDVPKTSWVVRGYDGWLNNDCNVGHDFFIEQDPGNGYGLALLAKAYLATGQREILDWLRRALVVADPYGRAAQAAFFQSHQISDNLMALSWEELHELAKKASVADVRVPTYKYRYYPYVMAALVQAGLEEKEAELVDFALDRPGMGQFHLRGPDVPEPIAGHYEPIPMAPVANTNPLADPLGRYSGWTRHPLQLGEIGFDFGEWGECEPGYWPVRPATRYPYRAPLPSSVEHDGANLIGLPWGTVWYANNVPYLLPDPATAADGRTMLVLGQGERVAIPIGKTARKIYLLGHVCRAQSPWKRYDPSHHGGEGRRRA